MSYEITLTKNGEEIGVYAFSIPIEEPGAIPDFKEFDEALKVIERYLVRDVNNFIADTFDSF